MFGGVSNELEMGYLESAEMPAIISGKESQSLNKRKTDGVLEDKMGKAKYILLHNTAYSDYYGDECVEIAKIVDESSGEDVLLICYEKNLFKERRYHICVDVYENEHGKFPVAKTDDFHRACLFNRREIFLTLMLHELGHYKNGDYERFEREDISEEDIRKERMKCAQEGRIQEVEKNADAFAARIVGKNTFMRAMDYMIARRKERNDTWMNVAIREFELRKKAVQNMR